MAHKIKALAITIGAALALTSFASQAEITLLKQDPQAGDPLSRLNFTVGGSIRPQFNMMSGDGDKGSYKRNGFDGGTRFRFAATTICLMILAGSAITSWASIFRHFSTGITTMPKARITPAAVCSIPA